MNLSKLWNDDEAVSPVIGVILMVAITVILAAVIATFVLGLGEQVSSTAPQASFSFDYTEGGSPNDFGAANAGDGSLKITHNGGETLTASNLAVRGSTPTSGGTWDSASGASYGANSEITAGDSITIQVNTDDTIQVTWTSDTGDNSATLSEWSGPDA